MVARENTGYSEMNRRTFLKLAALAPLAALPFSHPQLAAPRKPPPYKQLQKTILETIGGQEMGFDLRAITPDGFEAFRVEVNTDNLYPVASCFKGFLTLYYFWYMPKELWKTDRDSDIYKVTVFSDNLLAGAVLRDVAAYVDIYGNPIEKFNDFLLFMLGLQNGLHTWKWEGNPIEFESDRRFRPSESRYALVKGIKYSVDNLFTVNDLATGYDFIMRAAAGAAPKTVMTSLSDYDPAHAAEAARAALDLLSIPAKNYQSPLERAGFTYIGKDGILPNTDIATGNVVADAGIVAMGDIRYVMGFMSVGQTEYSAVETLQTIADAIRDYAV